MQLFFTIVIKNVVLEKVCVADIVIFSILLLENLVLVNTEKSLEVLELVQRDRSEFLLSRMISGGAAANPG